MKTRIRWAIGGGIAAIIAALFIGLSGGMGSGSGTPSPEVSNDEKETVDAVAPYFTVVVDGSEILVGTRKVTPGEAVEEAKKDGRPVEVLWKKAYTDAENALKKAFRAAEIPIQRESRR